MTEFQDCEIRKATREDLASVIAMLTDDALGTTRESPGNPPAECYVNAFEAMDADPRNEFFVLDIGDAVNGCLQLTYIPGLSRRGMERAQIESLRVTAPCKAKASGASSSNGPSSGRGGADAASCN